MLRLGTMRTPMPIASWLRREKVEPVEPLVTRKLLEELVDRLPTDKLYEEYLKRRWIGMVMWWTDRANEAKWKYFGFRGCVILGGVLLPVLATLSTRPGWQQDIALAIAVTGALVAACAAWEGVANYGEIWREKRRSAELLKVEGWLFLHRCGKYSVPQAGQEHFQLFVSEVEAMVAREVGEYLGLFDPSVEQGKRAAEEVMKAIAQVAVERVKQSPPTA
jgi:uncharacterized protein DUF4231